MNRISLWTLFALGASVAVAQPPPSKLLDPQEHRAQIRATLLEQTPVGSTMADVQKFIAQNLSHKPVTVVEHGATGEAAAKSANKGVKSIRVPLGNYVDNAGAIFLSAPLINAKEVTAQWAFDEQGRLLEIFVDKTTSTY